MKYLSAILSAEPSQRDAPLRQHTFTDVLQHAPRFSLGGPATDSRPRFVFNGHYNRLSFSSAGEPYSDVSSASFTLQQAQIARLPKGSWFTQITSLAAGLHYRHDFSH